MVKAVHQHVLVRLFRNVYVRADLQLSVEERARAAALVISAHAVVCDRTAAWIWGVDCFQFRELDVIPPLEVRTLRGHRACDRSQIRGGQRDLRDRDWVRVSGVRVTTPLRTAMDLGCVLGRRDALAAMDALARNYGLTSRDLVVALPTYARRRGVIQLRELAALVDPRAESPRESWVRLEMHDHGLPSPEVNWDVVVDGVPKYRIDVAYPHAKVAIEYNGEDNHTSPEDRRADAERREWLESHGWVVIDVDKHSFADEAVSSWIEQIRSALARAQRPPQRWYQRTRRY
jgi:very-short-patch-repair endonuclease